MAAKQEPVWTDSDAQRLDFAKFAHANLQDMVKVADAKATAILGIHSLIVSLLGSNLIDEVKNGVHAQGWWSAGLPALVTLLLTVGSLVASILVLVPRTKIREHVHPPRRASLLVWIDDLDRFQGKPDEYAATLAESAPPDLFGDVAYENLKIAWLLKRKFLFLPWSLGLLVAATLGWVVTLVWAVLQRSTP